MTSCFRLMIVVVLLFLSPVSNTVLASSNESEAGNKLELTSQERTWLAQHPVVRVRISPSYAPFEFFENGRYQGVAYDYLVKIGKKLGITFQPVSGLTWEQSLEKIKNREDIDLILLLTKSDSRAEYMEFTREYLSFPLVVFTQKDGKFISGISDLAGSVVAVEKGYIEKEWLERDVPGIVLWEVEGSANAIEAVATGKADAYVGNLALSSYYIDKKMYTNLKVAAPTPYQNDAMAMGVRKDWPELTGLINKALASLTPEEEREIRQRWLSIRYEYGIRGIDILKWVLGATAVALIFIVQLRNMVKRRTAELQSEVELRRIREQELSDSEEKFRSIFENAPVGIFQSTLSGRFISVNQTMSKLYGFSSPGQMISEVNDIASELFVSGELRLEIIKKVKDSDDYIRDEVEYRRRDGSSFYTNLYVRKVFRGAEETPFLEGFVEDITERKIAEENLREYRDNLEKLVAARTGELEETNNKLHKEIEDRINAEQELRHTLEDLAIAKERAEAADQLKSAFLATMSHELRTPLNSIIGFTGILLQKLVGPLNEEQCKQLSMVRNSANHLLSLISDVLDISKIEAGQMQVACEPFDLRASINKVAQTVQPLADKKGIELQIDIAPDIDMISSDARRVEQVLLNLLSNAVKFTEQGNIRLECLQNAEQVTFHVKDSGIGMGSEDLGKIFKPFHQIDSGSTRKYEGTGLGLSICKKLVELLGGSIWVESATGKGSSFGFSLPKESGRRSNVINPTCG